MKQLIIGVTPRINKNETNNFIRVNRNYIDRLTSLNMVPIILTPGSNLDLVLPLCDGFLVIGGDDYNPTLYNETNENDLSKDIDDEIDALDIKVITYAVNKAKPVLGICRGHQALSAVFGYKLYQDIEKANLIHPVCDKLHEVTKVNNFGLATLLPDTFKTNTFHHQATKNLPDDFVVLFKNHDVIEAVQHKTLPIIGIQWHPERMDTKESDIIFNYYKGLFK